MAEGRVDFYVHPQELALQKLLPFLLPHLPLSNPLYNRLRAPHNIPSRHCLFAATFPPGTEVSTQSAFHTVLFSDRSRHAESQIWLYNSVIGTRSGSLSPAEEKMLANHMNAAILFLKDTEIPEAPGWPFSARLRFACLHEHISSSLITLAQSKNGAVLHQTKWRCWMIPTRPPPAIRKNQKPLPEGFTVSRVPEDQLDIVLSTSEIQRQPSTMLMLPNVGLLNAGGKLVAWGYIGIDGSFATLYVLPDYRGKGLATYVATELLGRLGRGEFKDLGYDGESGWVHSDVKAGNAGSEGVMKALGGTVGWGSSYIHIDNENFH